MKQLLATVDEDFAQIDRLVRELRTRIAVTAEAVHAEAERVAKSHVSGTKNREGRIKRH